jgi:uncharacterized membrane protein YbhN (UPF0104 family)
MHPRDSKSSAGFAWQPALVWTLKIGVSVGLLYVLFSRIDTADLWAQMRAASIGWIVIALAMYALMVLVATWRWRVLLGASMSRSVSGRSSTRTWLPPSPTTSCRRTSAAT